MQLADSWLLIGQTYETSRGQTFAVKENHELPEYNKLQYTDIYKCVCFW